MKHHHTKVEKKNFKNIFGILMIFLVTMSFCREFNKIDQMDYLLNDLLGLYKKVLIEESLLLGLLNKEYHLENK
jgi:hypothetical protein